MVGRRGVTNADIVFIFGCRYWRLVSSQNGPGGFTAVRLALAKIAPKIGIVAAALRIGIAHCKRL